MSVSFCSVGDIVVDKYPQQNTALLGGTAFYSALAAQEAGAQVSLISALGGDTYSEKYETIFKENHIDITHLRHEDSHTSSIEITLDDNGRPEFSNWHLGALQTLDLTEHDELFIKKHDITRIALFTSFEHVFDQMFQMKLTNTLKVADFSGGSMYSNEKEILETYIDGFDIVSKSIKEEESQNLSYYEQLSKNTCAILVLTAGRNGSVCFLNGKKFVKQVNEIIDGNTTGAGDVYLTTFAISYKQTGDIQIAMNTATASVQTFLKNQFFRYKIPL